METSSSAVQQSSSSSASQRDSQIVSKPRIHRKLKDQGVHTDTTELFIPEKAICILLLLLKGSH